MYDHKTHKSCNPTDILQLKCLFTQFINELQVCLDYQNIICWFSYIPLAKNIIFGLYSLMLYLFQQNSRIVKPISCKFHDSFRSPPWFNLFRCHIQDYMEYYYNYVRLQIWNSFDCFTSSCLYAGSSINYKL